MTKRTRKVDANVMDLARESVAIHISRLDSKASALLKDYEAISARFPNHPCTVHIEEAKAICSLCRGLVEILLSPDEDSPA